MKLFSVYFLIFLLNFGFSEVRDLRYYSSFPDVFWFDNLQKQVSPTAILDSNSLVNQNNWQEFPNKHQYYTRVHSSALLSSLFHLNQFSYHFQGDFVDCDTCVHQVKSQWNLPAIFLSFPLFLDLNYKNWSAYNQIFEDGMSLQNYTVGLNTLYRQNKSLWTMNVNWNFEKTQGYFRFLKKYKTNSVGAVIYNSYSYNPEVEIDNPINPQMYELSEIQVLEGKYGQTPLWLDFNVSTEPDYQNSKKSRYQFSYSLYSKENAFEQTGSQFVDLFKNQLIEKLWILQTYDTLSHRFLLSYSRFSPSPWTLKTHPDFFNVQLRQWNVQLNLQSTQWLGQFLHINSTDAQNWTTSGQEISAQFINTIDQRFWLGPFYLNFEALICLPLGSNLIYTGHYYRMNQNMKYGWENDGSYAFSLFQDHQDDSPLDLYKNRLTIAKIRPSAGVVWKWKSIESDLKVYWNHWELGLNW